MPESIELFTLKEAARMVRVSVRRLKYWDETGLAPARARYRRQAMYTFADLVTLRAIKQLRDEQVPLQRIRKAARQLQRLYPTLEAPASSLTLVNAGREVVVAFSDPSIGLDISNDGQLVWRLPVAKTNPKRRRGQMGLL